MGSYFSEECIQRGLLTMNILIFQLVLTFGFSWTLAESFNNVEVKNNEVSCTCSFKLELQGDSVDVAASSASCDENCNGYFNHVQIGGPVGVNTLFRVSLKVNNGLVELQSVSLDLAVVSFSSSLASSYTSSFDEGTFFGERSYMEARAI